MKGVDDQVALRKYKLLDSWTRFFQLDKSTEQELLEITQEPIMEKAYKALEELSQEPSARELAEMREKSRINLQIITSETEARAKAEGKAEGKAETQRNIIQKMLHSGMTQEQVCLVLSLDKDQLQKLLG